ncbi:hypothetical protein PSH61_01475 [Pseudomonas rhodesiae]|uniref:hypothetical protein n=1 Tax=Pseudomonas rhodesiae TaxID=76760 RepID=UPI000B8BDA73|nr:hypothetical protein [Pseudomonas rhodesiae]OXS20699.1 hypothetical protein CGU36_19410 [Pseudomonas fluorescens]OZO46104.1 hypothetical protein CGU37_25850 [Pseudomonas fluorescens]TGY16346.1 hypothetical protein E5845_18175 [Pseudomonas fluorescens]WLI29803.1 hypothetical protein PSH61_01475 [Pseudomonas rhodesiae]
MSISEIFDYVAYSGAGLSIVAAVISFFISMKDSELRDALLSILKARNVSGVAKAYLKILEYILDVEGFSKLRIVRAVTIILNSSLALSIARVSEQAASGKDDARKSRTIVGLMLGEKIKQSTKIQGVLFLVLLVNAFSAFVNDSEMNSFVILVVFIGLSAVFVDHKLIEYRINNGWYGKNEFESREIIRFVLAHADKDDFNDRGGLKKIVPEPSFKTTSDFSFSGTQGSKL